MGIPPGHRHRQLFLCRRWRRRTRCGRCRARRAARPPIRAFRLAPRPTPPRALRRCSRRSGFPDRGRAAYRCGRLPSLSAPPPVAVAGEAPPVARAVAFKCGHAGATAAHGSRCKILRSWIYPNSLPVSEISTPVPPLRASAAWQSPSRPAPWGAPPTRPSARRAQPDEGPDLVLVPTRSGGPKRAAARAAAANKTRSADR